MRALGAVLLALCATSGRSHASDLNAVLQEYCITCHNDTTLLGNLSLESFDVVRAHERAETAEKMIVKLRAGMMPPPDMPRPSAEILGDLVTTIETVVDRAAAEDPNPGARRFQRLNRKEYERVVKDLLALDVDASRWLPADTYLGSFDNIFFLWGTAPDAALLDLASAQRLSQISVLEREVGRMLEDPRSEALATRFAGQWLRLQDAEDNQPEPYLYPDFTGQLRDDLVRETELLFESLVREDRSLLELFNSDSTFLNERLARHYGIPGVAGESFRRVSYPDDARRGVLGHGSVLLATSMSARTSPVLRGKWVMEVLLGTPPPPPPPNIPAFDDTKSASGGRRLTTRERLELHRANPTCHSCHRFMDPIGLALDGYDVTGRLRTRENGVPLDTRGTFYDGTEVGNPRELVGALLKRPIPLVRNFTANLLAYAIGRRVEYFDQPAIRRIARDAQANDYRMSSFILGVVKSDPFQRARAQAAPERKTEN